ncbi:MAG: class I SAM-dependent methyltransferase [Deltaproteobacteria bacterium]|nr:class I SAM-dependent methyltransferase [Deltaproteobacteria bacterium]
MRSIASEWDYTAVALAYLKRPPYAPAAIDAVLAATAPAAGARACDVGAGTGNLTRPLLAAGLDVVALEPNAAMRALGRRCTAGWPRLRWVAAYAEATALRSAAFDLVTFGSSFNCVERERAVHEASRILVPAGTLVCLWNHRRLDDPLQARIEARIRDLVPTYAHGIRREDQAPILERGGLFTVRERIEREVVHRVAVVDCIDAWRSHVTLKRHAGERFAQVVDAISRLLRDGGRPYVDVPYITRAWVARRR